MGELLVGVLIGFLGSIPVAVVIALSTAGREPAPEYPAVVVIDWPEQPATTALVEV